MNEESPLEKTLDELIEEIADLPQNIFTDAENKQSHSLGKGKKESVFLVCSQDLLNELRLYLKYLLFDLDATRRENHYLKQLLDEDK